MEIKEASTPERVLLINNKVVVVSTVKGDASLYRIVVDSTFKGYLQRRNGELFRVDGSSISDSKFEQLCKALK